MRIGHRGKALPERWQLQTLHTHAGERPGRLAFLHPGCKADNLVTMRHDFVDHRAEGHDKRCA
jgi:hypothetical protein